MDDFEPAVVDISPSSIVVSMRDHLNTLVSDYEHSGDQVRFYCIIC